MKMKFHNLIDIMMMYNKLHEDGPSKPDEPELYNKPDENEYKLKNITNDESLKLPTRKLSDEPLKLPTRKLQNIIIIISLVMIVVFLSIFLPLYLTKGSTPSTASASTPPASAPPTANVSAAPTTNASVASTCIGYASSWVCGSAIGLDVQSIYWCQYNSTIGVYAHCVSSQCISNYCESGIGAVNAIAYPWGISCGSAINVTSQPTHLFLGNDYTQLMDLGSCATGCCVQSFGTNDKCC
jgi:hypothetical protein